MDNTLNNTNTTKEFKVANITELAQAMEAATADEPAATHQWHNSKDKCSCPPWRNSYIQMSQTAYNMCMEDEYNTLVAEAKPLAMWKPMKVLKTKQAGTSTTPKRTPKKTTGAKGEATAKPKASQAAFQLVPQPVPQPAPHHVPQPVPLHTPQQMPQLTPQGNKF